MLTVILVLSILLAGALIAIFLLYKEINNTTLSLREINRTQTNALLSLSAPNQELEGLAAEINRTLAQKQEAEARYKRTESRQRRDIENISHDLRTPLTSVIGYIQLLDDSSLTNEERTRYKEILLSRAKSLEGLISGFYDLSRLECGEYRYTLTPVHLQNILCEILASFYQDFTARGIEPQADIDQTALPVLADENAVRRVFTNLIQNVLKHSGEHFTAELRQGSGSIVTTFANDAPQLSEEDAEHLLERFYTADRMRSGQNTGLGLAIVKELVEGMGGAIHAKLSDGRLFITIQWTQIASRPPQILRGMNQNKQSGQSQSAGQ